ncbi:DegQ family serine endoprotease [Marinobacter salicampi]|uniref:DegQ family serine endoprotease n=1 Tax=Marinobacter salicampi TaxID=435907 RepID=UPI003BF8DC53
MAAYVKRQGGVTAFLLAMLIAAMPLGAADLPDFTGLVKDNADAVVNISTTQERPQRTSNMPFDQRQLEQLPEFFQEFFRGPNSPFGQGAPGRSQPVTSMGSGFIVSKDGYVLTNNHVVEGADEIIVRLNDRREMPAELVGTDPRSDMAVLKINDEEDLPVVRIGESDGLEPGEWVFAIGSPFGFDYTVTAGIVSAVGRALPSENYVPFIQTDVAINPGNSGGPLFNLEGKVVGINSQIYTRSGGFMGVSFAIPIDEAMNVFQQIRDEGSVARGWLGVLIQEVNRDLAESFGLSRPRGALVAEVIPDSPAADAGLKAGDIVLEYNGKTINLSSDLPPMVGTTQVGKTAELKVLREGKTMNIDVEIERLPGDEDQAQATEQQPGTQSGPLGLQVEPLTDEIKEAMEVEHGVLVANVSQGPALKAGVRPNDIITELNRKEIRSVEDFRKAATDLPEDKAVSVRVVREGRATYLVMKP